MLRVSEPAGLGHTPVLSALGRWRQAAQGIQALSLKKGGVEKKKLGWRGERKQNNHPRCFLGSSGETLN